MQPRMHGRVCLLLAALTIPSLDPARAELPPLVPRQALFGTSQLDWPQISPDGTRLAYLAPSEDEAVNVWVRTLGKSDSVMVTHDTRQGIGLYAWAWDAEHILYLQDRDGDENLHLWSADFEGKVVRDLTPFQGVRASNLLTNPARPNEVLVGLNLRDARLFDMYRIDLTTGACVLDTQNPGDVLGWTTDASFVIRAACALDARDGTTVVRVRDAADRPWRDLFLSPFGDTHILGQVNGGSLVAGFDREATAIYVVSSLGSDKTRLVKLDVATGRELATLAEDARCDIAAAWGADAVPRFQVMIDPATLQVQAVEFEDSEPHWKILDPAVKADFDFLRGVHAGAFRVTGRDRADRRWIVRFETPDASSAYYLYDRDAKRAQFLFEEHPEWKQYTLAPVQGLRIRARDGLQLPAYLTLPVGVPPKKLPLVLDVHGGPWARDSWGFDPAVQWLANRGYAVLQVNYRGSIGFGKKFLNAGNGEWGRKMQDDLTDGVQWAVQKGIADPKRVAILGGSYGGYATLAGLAFTPDVYACGVDIVGPSSVATLFASIPPYWAPVKKRWILRVGDAEHDDELNRRISPLYHVDAIRAPLLLGHGANDPRVKISESEQIVKALRDKGVPVDFVVYPDEGHGFARPENNLDFFGRAEEFLAKHLGGRAEPWQAVPGSSAEVR